uniref:C-type lectin domain-containing protein n=1 Tax=Xiphophorus couchianus TaxID=32473 RepID=A0A3B5LCA2_9TELE
IKVSLTLSLLSFSLCQERQYYFVKKFLNWDEAQRYCRKHHTDLATIGNSKDVKQFLDIVSSADDDVWIGLYSNINWTWSGLLNRWWDYDCAKKFPFVCYNGNISVVNKFVAVDEAMSWSNARTYCRHNFTDLATIGNIKENQWVQTLVPTGYWAWTGLYRDENIYWSDKSSFGFSNWDHISNLIGSDARICGATSKARSAKWKFLPCQTRLPFVCYSFKGEFYRSLVKQMTDLGRKFSR